MPNIFLLKSSLLPVLAKSSKAFSVTRIIWFFIKALPSFAPSSGCFRQHSHSITAHPGKSYCANLLNTDLKIYLTIA